MKMPIKYLAIAVVGSGLLATISFGGFFLAKHLVLAIKLENQSVQISLPRQIKGTAEVNNMAEIGLRGNIHTTVPFSEVVKVPLHGQYYADVSIRTKIPIAFEVAYEGTIAVDTMANIVANTTLDFGSVKQLRNLTFSTAIPMQFDLPISLKIPISDTIDFSYNAPMEFEADEELSLKLDTEFETTIKVDQLITTPITSKLQLVVQLPDREVNASIDEAELALRLSTLKLETAQEAGKNERR